MRSPSLTLLLLILLQTSTALAQPGVPRIEIVGGNLIDLGRQRAGRIERTVAITNRGGDTLRLQEISSGCGCLVGEPDRRALAPGDTAHVLMTIEATGYAVDTWARTLEITSNDPANRIVPVTVRALFGHEAKITSPVSTVQRTPCDSTGCTWFVEITNTGDSSITVGAPLVEEMRGVAAEFDMNQPIRLKPGEHLTARARVTILGEEEIPQALVLFTTSSRVDNELRAAFFYVVK